MPWYWAGCRAAVFSLRKSLRVIRSACIYPTRGASTAVVHASAQIAATARLGAHVVIGADVVIEDDVTVHANVSISDRVRLQRGVEVMSNVSIYADVDIGPRSSIHSGAVIGSPGFGFTPDQNGHLQTIAQLGGVSIGADVRVGAGTTIDRGAIDNTVIEDGVKMDDQVHIGHNQYALGHPFLRRLLSPYCLSHHGR